MSNKRTVTSAEYERLLKRCEAQAILIQKLERDAEVRDHAIDKYQVELGEVREALRAARAETQRAIRRGNWDVHTNGQERGAE